MPGAFAHITAGNEAGTNDSLNKLNIPPQAKLILSRQKKFIELGCVSPDYPYLSVTDPSQANWADKMHYKKSGDILKAAVRHVRTISDSSEQEKAFAWVCGYAAHVIADITIHPVVERKVGPYQKNQNAHRKCEMNQDSYIWKRMNLGQIGLADRIKDNIGACSAEDDSLDETIHQVWLKALSEVHPDAAATNPPDINKWHKSFVTVVDTAEESYRLFPIARHVAVNCGLTYPLANEVDDQFISNLDTPLGEQHYDDIFDRAVKNICHYWTVIANAIFTDGSLDPILNWNLDNGKCQNGYITAWETK